MQPTEQALMLAGLVAGILAPFVVQIVKNLLNTYGDKALALAFLISLVLGFLIALVAGVPFPAWTGDPVLFVVKLGELAGVAFALATIIYKVWLEKIQSGVLANAKR